MDEGILEYGQRGILTEIQVGHKTKETDIIIEPYNKHDHLYFWKLISKIGELPFINDINPYSSKLENNIIECVKDCNKELKNIYYYSITIIWEDYYTRYEKTCLIYN
jgi:hypothetical protein